MTVKKCIELEKAIAEIEEAFKVHWEVPCDHKDHVIQNTVTRILEILRKQPEVDAVKVKCRDCDYGDICYPEKKIGEEAKAGCYCELRGRIVEPDGFCSCGKKKEGDKNG